MVGCRNSNSYFLELNKNDLKTFKNIKTLNKRKEINP
jgi:hypothetical protein